MPEESTSYTIGFVYTPGDSTTITMDFYDITIEDRIALQNFTIGDAELAQLQVAGIVLSFNYTQDIFEGLLRVNRYGDWKSTGGWFGPGDSSDVFSYGSAVLVDLEGRVVFDDKYRVVIGGENIFDEYPDREGNGVLNFLGQQHAITSPFGFNGAFWYMRISADF